MNSQPLFGIDFFSRKIISVAKLRTLILSLCMSQLRGIDSLRETLVILAEQMEQIGKNPLTQAERLRFGQLAGLINITNQELVEKERVLGEQKFQYSTIRNTFVTEAGKCQTFEDVMDLVSDTKIANPDFWPEAINLTRMFFSKPLRHPEQEPDEIFLGNFFNSSVTSYKKLIEAHPNFTNPEVIAAGLPNVNSIRYTSARTGNLAYSVSTYNNSHIYPIISYLQPVFVKKTEMAEVGNSVQE